MSITKRTKVVVGQQPSSAEYLYLHRNLIREPYDVRFMKLSK